MLSTCIFSGRSNISSKYTISETSSTPNSHAGLWKVQRAVRSSGGPLSAITSVASSGQDPNTPDGSAEGSANVTSNGGGANNDRAVVSVWSHSLGLRTKDRQHVLDVLKKEVS